jgi:hypothetical protein
LRRRSSATISRTAEVGGIKLGVVCTDIEKAKNLLKKIDVKTILIREIENGKWKRPGGQMSNCPGEVPRVNIQKEE